MLKKDDFLSSLLHECNVCLHLYGELPPDGLEYRQSPAQRSTLELLRYIAFCGIGGTCEVVDGGWDGYKHWEERHGSISAEEFPAAMERQKEALRAKFAEFTDDDLTREATLPMGVKTKLSRALLEVPVKWMTGYRMQLFLNVKAAGNQGISTRDCWLGASKPEESAPTA